MLGSYQLHRSGESFDNPHKFAKLTINKLHTKGITIDDSNKHDPRIQKFFESIGGYYQVKADGFMLIYGALELKPEQAERLKTITQSTEQQTQVAATPTSPKL